MRSLDLALLPETLAVCHLGPHEPIPSSVVSASFVAIARTADELSIVCSETLAPAGARVESGWRSLRVTGTLPFAATGIMASLVTPLADAAIPIFAISTFETDYLLVKASDLARSIDALEAAGHRVRR